MWDFTYEETINAPIERVFSLITNLDNYQNWNPFLIEGTGTVEMDGVVSGKSYLEIATTSYRHRIFEYVPNQVLGWRDFGLMAYLVCGERSRYTKRVDGKTHFKCYLKIRGPLSGLVNAVFGNGLRHGVIAEAQALKKEAEKE